MTRRKDGLWQESVTIAGKRRFFYGKTKSEVLKKIRAYEVKQDIGALFEPVAEQWWEEHSKTLTWNSQKPYRPALRRAIEAFGEIPIREIIPTQISREIRRFATTHAEKTVKTQLSIYKLIFSYAVQEGYINSNPARDLSVPSGLKKSKRHAASSEDIAKVKASTECPFGMFLYWVLYTGLRRGELLALEWKDVDLKNRTVTVNKSLYHEHNRPVIKPPKTEVSIGCVPIPDALLEKITPRRGLIFPGSDGKHMTRGEYNRLWKKYKAESGVQATPHEFRHTYATMLFENDIPPEEMQLLLRHAQLSTTMDIYTDIRDAKLRAVHQKVYKIDIA